MEREEENPDREKRLPEDEAEESGADDEEEADADGSSGRGRLLLWLDRVPVLRDAGLRRPLVFLASCVAVSYAVVAIYWSFEPAPFDVNRSTADRLQELGGPLVPGYTMTSTLVATGETLLDKPGGYITNDRLSPGAMVDNIKHWEFGVLVQIRDLVKILRNDFSRSRTQSREDVDLGEAEPFFNIDSDTWILPSSEEKYRQGIGELKSYLKRLNDDRAEDAQFFTRSDNLAQWLDQVEKRLGSLSQRLIASVGQVRHNTDLVGSGGGQQATKTSDERQVRTPWMELDDNFYEARGTCWALLHYLRAVEVDFKEVLEKRNARPALKQIIRELEPTQETIWSPMILNGSGFGWEANHSLVMASYISGATAAIMELRALLQRG